MDLRVVPSIGGLIKWLGGSGHYANRNDFPLPDIVVTEFRTSLIAGDLSALDFLRWQNKRTQHLQLPTIINYQDATASELAECKKLGALACIKKGGQCLALTQFIVQMLKPQNP